MKKSKNKKDTFPRPNTNNQNRGGRKLFDGKPKSMVLDKLKHAFSIGANIKRACAYAEISYDAYNDYVRDKPELVQLFERLRQKQPLKAESNVTDKLNQGDIETSKWVLERRAKEDYSPRQEISGPDGGPIEVSPAKRARILKLLEKNRHGK